ncbi:hypothetical protein [Alicyclobacillus sp. SO9]|uniref:hypothetical protein n=1 Tax=Alicyclobacillus sp. SO9 TaxID=2665646 RepID=UPI0018E8F6F4|nr:hypothetical protein [Alicyclobacillus sp. SO9]QQE77648.1 hypothetical protein GI364_17155 [Alicyclobacillus sp. SO9]
MKKFMTMGALLCVLGANAPVALANSSVQQTSSAHSHADGVYSVAAEPFTSPHHTTHNWQIESSIQVSRSVLKEAYLASREAYTKKLEKYAKVTPRDAQKKISATHPKMNIEHVQLRNIRTSLVYMGLAVSDQDKYLVIIDAGNGKVLMDRQLPTHHTRVFSDK